MDFSIAEPLMLKYGITPEQIKQLKALADKLPSDVVDGTRMPTPYIPGLSAFESELLMARMLDAIAPMFGISTEGADLLDLAGYPDMRALMKKADRRMHARRRWGTQITLKRSERTEESEAGALAEKPHLHA